MNCLRSATFLTLLALPLMAQAQTAPTGLEKNKPVEISSDKLDVFQPEHKAIFSGNVIAVQGTTNMRAATMIVFYRDENKGAEKPAAPPPTAAEAVAEKPASPQGIYRIEAEGGVVFTTPGETAMGEKAVYNVDNDTIELMGGNVTLTRGQNLLKGTKLTHNMKTGRSILTGGVSTENAGKPARVHGLFVPKSSDESGAAKP